MARSTIRVDHNLVDPQAATDEFNCPVSMELLTTAHQTSCCGKHLSEEVVNQLQAQGKPCPMCNRPQLQTMPDLYFRRKVTALKVYCPNKKLGCRWEGEIGDVDKHLNYKSTDGECKYVKVSCPYVCMGHVERRRLKEHLTNVCLKRPFKCNYCNYEASYQIVTQDHLPKCEKFPVQCPIKCGEIVIREKIQSHLDDECPNTPVECEFSYAGCDQKLIRKDMTKHMDDNIKSHLVMVAAHAKRKDSELEALKSQIHALTNILARQSHPDDRSTLASRTIASLGFMKPPIFTLSGFEDMMKQPQGIMWYSPPFYSHIGGYKMCLYVSMTTSERDPRRQYLAMFFVMMAGEFDHTLVWPFYGKIVVQLLNQRRNKAHATITLIDDASYNDPLFNKAAVQRVNAANRHISDQASGCPKAILLKNLYYDSDKDIQFLSNDCLNFQVIKVSLLLNN